MSGVWKESFSEKHQKKFWKNKETGESTWKDPTGETINESKKKSSKTTTAIKSSTVTTDAVETAASTTDWVQSYSEKKKAPYWKNKVTGESTWKDPTISTNKIQDVANQMKSSDSGTGAISSEWTEHYSAKHQKPYWKNSTTGKSTFTNPSNSKIKESTEKSTIETITYNPEEWEEKYDKKKEKKYWKNKITGKATYNDPSRDIKISSIANTSANKEDIAVDVNDWIEKYSEKHKKPYWKNRLTNTTTWINPTTTTTATTVANMTATSSNNDLWDEKYDKKSNRKYWKNKETGKSTFKDPTSSSTSIEKKSDEISVQSGTTTIATMNHSSDWIEKFSEKHHKKYWKNKETGKTSWTPPPLSSTTTEVVNNDKSNNIAKSEDSTTAASSDVWIESYSEKYKRTCWKNTLTHKTTYTKPLNWSLPTTTEVANSGIASTSTRNTVLLKGIIDFSYSAAVTESELDQHIAYSSSNNITTYERRLLQLRSIDSSSDIELDILKYTSEFTNRTTVPSSSSTVEPKTQILRSFRLHSIRSLLCNKVAGVVSIVLPPGGLIEAVPHIPATSTASTSTTTAAKDLEQPLVVASATSAVPGESTESGTVPATSTAAASFDKFDHIDEPAISATSSASEAATIETPSMGSMYCSLHLHFANVRTAQAWYRLIIQRLKLSEMSEAPVSETNSTLPIVYDFTAKEVAISTEEEDHLLGVYNLAGIDVALQKLEAEWLYPPSTAEHHLYTSMQSIVSSRHSSISPSTQSLSLPSCGMLLFKILTVHDYSSDTDHQDSPIAPGSDSTTAQMKGWISCYIRIDTATNTISFYDQGLHSPPSLSVTCESATLHIPDLTNPEIGYECNLYHCNIINQIKKSKISIAIKLHDRMDLFVWMLTLSSMIENVTYSNNGMVHAVTMIDYLQDNNIRSSTRSTTSSCSSSMNICNRPYITDICTSIIESLAERKLCSSYMRHIQLTGVQLNTTRFLHINHRIILLIKGNNHHLTEGSILLSINGLSTLTTPASTILKFIQDLPRTMIANLILWKFPRKEFRIRMIKLNINEDNSDRNNSSTATRNTNITSTSPNNNIEQYNNMTGPGTTTINSNQFDSKSKLNRVIIQKRNSILKASSGQDATYEGIEYPAIIENLQRELLQFDLNQNKTLNTNNTNSGVSNNDNSGSSVVENIKKENEDISFTIADYMNKPIKELQWSHSRIMIASGNVTFLMDDQITIYRIQLSSCELKLVLPHTSTDSSQSISSLGIHICDHKTSILVQCATLELLLDLVEGLLVAMKMHGSYNADLGYLYDQAVYWQKMTTTASSSVNTSSTNSTKNIESNTMISRSQQSLLIQSIEENTPKKKEFTMNLIPNSSQAIVTSFSDTLQNPIISSSHLTTTTTTTNDVESNILVAAEELENVLSSLHLPLNFPTHTTIEKEIVELFKINNSNHRLLAEFLTLQFDVMHPVSEAAATASVVSRSKSFSNYMPNSHDHLRDSDERSTTSNSATASSSSGAETKYPLSANSDASQSSEKAAMLEEKGLGEGSSSENSDAVLREKLFAAITGNAVDTDTTASSVATAAEEKKEHEVSKEVSAGSSDEVNTTLSLLPPPPSTATSSTPPTTRRTSIQMRSGSVMMSSATPALSTHTATANRRATFRKSAITHSQEQAAVLLMSKMEKQIMLQSVLTKTDRQAVSVLLNHLRTSPPDLINMAMRFTSSTDVKGLAHFIVHRLCVYWSAEQRQLEEIIYAAALAECSQYQKISRHSGQLVQTTIVRDHHSTTTHTSISFLHTLLTEISNRVDIVVYIQSLCESISIESLTEDSGVSDLCARVVEPFCRRFEAGVVLNTMPIALKHALCALLKCQDSSISPYEFLSICMLPHILNAIIEQNKYASSNLDVCLSDAQLETILDRVRELVNMCFSQDSGRHKKICLSDQAALSRSKWFIERSLQYVLDASQPSVNNSNNSNPTAHSSPIARLAGIQIPSGKSTAMQGLICLRPSELFFILQSMELTNISAAPLSASSRELAQAIAHMHSSDLLQRLHSELRLTPLPGHTPPIQQMHDRELTGTGILDALNETGISFLDREVTFLLYITPHAVYNNEFMPHFNDETTVPVVVPSVKGFNSSHNGSGGPSSIYSTASSTDFELSSLLTSESIEESSEAHSLASIRWLIQAARSSLKSLYEHHHSSNIIRNYSTIQELNELKMKLLSRKDEILSILADWKKIAICIEICTNYKAQISLLMEKYKFQKKLYQENEHSPMYWNSRGVNSTDTASNIYDIAPSTVSLIAANEKITMAITNKEKEVQTSLSQIILLQLQLESELQKTSLYEKDSSSHSGTASTTTSSSRLQMSSPVGGRLQSRLASLTAVLSPNRVQQHNNNNQNTSWHSPSTTMDNSHSMATPGSGGSGSPATGLLLRSRAPNPLHVVMKSVFASSNTMNNNNTSTATHYHSTSPRKL